MSSSGKSSVASTSMRRLISSSVSAWIARENSPCSERTAERAALRGRGIDQVGDRLGLGQIHLAVEEGAAAEFTGFGQPGAEVEAAREQHLHDDRAAVALQFEDVFAGKGMRIREKQQNSAVDRSTVGRRKSASVA